MRGLSRDQVKANNNAAKRHYRESIEGRRRQVIGRRKHQKRAMEMLHQLKSKPCTDCGGIFDPVCMDFDHRPDEIKVAGVSTMVLLSRHTLLAEIAKCDLVCSNCHRIRTFRKRDHAALSRERNKLAGRSVESDPDQMSLDIPVLSPRKER